jgi:hypothetical protein
MQGGSFALAPLFCRLPRQERRDKSLSKRIPLRSPCVNHTLIKGISHQINEEE